MCGLEWLLLFCLLTEEAPSPTPPGVAQVERQIARGAAQPYLSNEQRQALETCLEQGLRDYPAAPPLLFWQADLLERQGNTAAAERLWTRLVKEANTPVEVKVRCWQRLAYRSLAEDALPQARHAVDQALALAPTDEKNYLLLLELNLRDGQLPDTLARLRQAVDQYGETHPALWAVYLEVLTQTGQLANQQAELQRRLEANPLAPDAQHYRARLAESQGDEVEAFLHHFLAMNLGDRQRDTTAYSRQWIGRLLQRESAGLPARLVPLVNAYVGSAPPRKAAQALAALEQFAPATPSESLVTGHLRVQALLALGKEEEARQTWAALINQWPNYVPALCGLAEIAAANRQDEEAERWLAAARQAGPNTWKVHQFNILGGDFRCVDEGVEVVAVEAGGHLDRFGIHSKDILIKLERELLQEMAPRERLSRVRLFRGGMVTYRTATGQELTREMLPPFADE